MSYLKIKGHVRTMAGMPQRGSIKGKPEKYKFFTEEQIEQLLKAVEEDKDNPRRYRDHAALFCGFYFALRIKETSLLERDCLKWLEDNVVDIPTLKQRSKEVGPDGKKRAPWRRLPQIETIAIEYLTDYIKNKMPPNQKYLFVSRRPDRPIAARTLDNIFNTYRERAGLSINYSWHALRHARGVYLYERFKDLLLVKKMLRHTSIASTEIYAHLSPSKLAERQEILDRDSIKINPLK
jgi:integrase/recombinase XerD